MENKLELLILWPFLGFLISLLLPPNNEKLISRYSFFMVGIHFFATMVMIVLWIYHGSPSVDIPELALYDGEDITFNINFFFDKVTAVYALIGSMLTFLVTTYSRLYLHRESGYKRFFVTILLFYAGYILAVFAGNLETLFIGWEIIGLTSFLLIAFYRERYLPVKNAYKVFSIYRIGDVGLILAMWAIHHLWHDGMTFMKLSNYELVHEHLEGQSLFAIFISCMILLAASVKSAQFPFSSWLPRAMEGPTPSSAIFYGSLSVHLGAFLLLRTMPIWENQILIKVLIIAGGVITTVIGSMTARVQSSIKSQIAYGSVSQIGLIFIEIALGFENIALVHFAGNAFLRTYQLLVSPSAVSYMIREQFYNFEPKIEIIETGVAKKLEYSLYLLSIKEWNMDLLLDKLIWSPLKNMGKALSFINHHNFLYITIPALIVAAGLSFIKGSISPTILGYLPEIFAFVGLLLVFRAYASRKHIILSWVMVVMNHFWVLLAISFNDSLTTEGFLYYITGVVSAGILGLVALMSIRKQEKNVNLNSFQGHGFEHPKLALAFLIACLGLAGFPITSTFIGEDILFSHIKYDQVFLAFFASLGFVISGISLIRMYARIFLGPHVKKYHAVAFKSS